MSLSALPMKKSDSPDSQRRGDRKPFTSPVHVALSSIRRAFGLANRIEGQPGGAVFAGADLLRIPSSALTGTLIINAFGLVLPIAVLEVYDAIIPHQANETLFLLVIGFICITAIEVFLRVGRSYVAGFSAAKFEAQNVALAIERIAFAQRAHMDAEQDTRHVARITSINRLSEYYGGQMRWALLDFPFVFLYLGCMALIAGWLAIVPVLLLIVFMVISTNVTEPMLDIAKARDEEDSRLYHFIAETLSGVTAIKGAAMEAFMARRFERLLGRNRQLGRDAIAATGHAETLSALFGNITFIAIGAVGGWMAINGDLTIGSLAASTLLAGRVIQPVMRASGIVRSMNLLTVARDEANKALSVPQIPAAGAGVNLPPRPQLVARGLHLPRSATSAASFDLDIAFGETICVTSSNAADQLALLMKLSGEHVDLDGDVTFGGEPVGGLRLAGRRGIVFTSPQSTLFKGTILQNLTAFGHGATLEEVVAVCDLLGLRESIDRLPAGFETMITDEGNGGISDSLARLIVIARAIALRPRMIVLDEPQAMLDRDADQRFLEGLRKLKGHVTLIIGSQRPSYLALGDRTFVLERGRLQLRTLESGRTPTANTQSGGGR
jgi:ATP-binding cassette subfamily C protein LapB